MATDAFAAPLPAMHAYGGYAGGALAPLPHSGAQNSVHAQPPKPVDEFKVPDEVVHTRVARDGSEVLNHYYKGRLLGKVSGLPRGASQRCALERFDAHPLPQPHDGAQGGFARCFKFEHGESGTYIAGKVVDKASLIKAKARSKVRGASRRVGWRAGSRRATCTPPRRLAK